MIAPSLGGFLRLLGAAVLVALTYLALGPLPAIAGAWLLWSPDPVAETGRAGGVGAAGAGARAAAAHLAQEWRRGAPARARRRSERRDRWWDAGGWRRGALHVEHAGVLAYRGLRSLVVAGSRGLHAMPGGARHGVATARHHAPRGRAAARPVTPANTTAPTSPVAGPTSPVAGPTTPPSTPPPAGGSSRTPTPGLAAPEGAPSSPGGRVAAGTAAPITGGQMTDHDYAAADGGGVGPAGPGSGELTTTADLRAEVTHMQGLIEQAEVLAGQLRDWQAGLPDRYEAAAGAGGPQTQGLSDAVGEVTEAAGDGPAFGQALNALRRACDQADVLGEEADAIGAGGHTSGYVSA